MKRPALTTVPDPGIIEIRGARQNNLKGIDLDLPLGKLSVITGPSGSGKSSLAFDTIYAEGQRRYVETFSPYTRQFLERMDKPKVDEIRGIPPAIAIEQSNPVKTTRSTVGTMTEINDYLKLVMPRIVEARCPECSRKISPETAQAIVQDLYRQQAGETLLVTFTVPAPPKTVPSEFFTFLQQQGYLRVWLDEAVVRTDEPAALKKLPALVPVIQDRVTVNEENRSRLCEAIETALRFGKGRVQIQNPSSKSQHPYSTGWHCAHCDLDITPPTPGLFSFNHPTGACPDCRGFGRSISIDLQRAIPDRSLSVAEGAVKPFQTENGRECQRDLLSAARKREFDTMCPFEELSQADQDWVMYGENDGTPVQELSENGQWYGVKGFFEWLESKAYKMHVRVLLARYRSYTECPTCHGGRYQPATLNFRFAGKTMPQLMGMPVGELHALLSGRGKAPAKPAKAPAAKAVAGKRRAAAAKGGETVEAEENGALPKLDASCEMLFDAVRARLGYLVEVGLGYLSLDRSTRTLSGGEVERVNLTTCLGASLVNTLFVLDEPSIGLHPRDVGRLIRVMQNLRDKGNTLLVVEHEEAVMRAADHLIEIGPGRGELGGELVFEGKLDDISKVSRSLTGAYLSGKKSIPVPAQRREPKAWIKVQGAKEHNLQNIDVDFPLGVLVCVTGVSGSGKSTLVHDVLFGNLLQAKGLTPEEPPGACKKLQGGHRVEQVIMVDQSPLARTPRSSPALYLGTFDTIRDLFSDTADALAQGLTASSFSFNAGTGRCERCAGNGFEKIEMQFLSDVFVRCPECEGKRFQQHVLDVHLRGHSIHDVLQMTVTRGIEFFSDFGGDKIIRPLTVLAEVGLGYLTLGQPLNVLSGGESQRLKLVERLVNQKDTDCLLIFDEPTTGLHFDDVAMLVKVFERLVEQGNTVLVIEHNLEVIKCADYVLDLGPEGGTEGGFVVALGTPEEVAKVDASHTGRFLRQMFAGGVSPWALPMEELAMVAETGPAYEVPTRNCIAIHGAREHNLKNLSLEIPRDQMVIITGLSGSGKSTLAFDILFAEGQRRFLDSMSVYARQFVTQLEKPDVDMISGLPPSVAIEQRITRGGGKSTVATVTEVYHFLRLLFAKLGTQFCPKCNVPVEKQTLAAVTKKAESIAKSGRIRVLAPVIKARKGFHADVAKWALKQGFEELLIDGKFERADKFPKLERFREHTIDVVIGERNSATRIQELLKRALDIGKGTARILDAKGKAHVVSTEMSCPGCGQSFEELDPRLFSFNSPHGACEECRGFGEVWKFAVDPKLDSAIDIELSQERQHECLEDGESRPCPSCNGARLNEVARNVRLQDRTINELTSLPVSAALVMLAKLKFGANQKAIAQDIIPEISQRLTFMGQVGLDYLSLNRSAKTLSGGESQRIRLAAQLGSNLRGVLYVLDEPTIGLHPRDNAQLLDTLATLKSKGNSLVIVEHDEDTMRRADTIIDLGPGAGSRGGQIVAQGTLAEIQANENSSTGRCLREPMKHPVSGSRRSLEEVERWLEIRGAQENNLKNIDVRFPIGRLTVITGISGSGKSTLMRGVLKPAVSEALARKGRKAPGASSMTIGISTTPLPANLKFTAKLAPVHEHLEAVYEVDQSPIGKTSRSTPATYIKVFDSIRELFSSVPLSRIRGYTASRFSFNAEGGRCETCLGQGVIKVEMQFLPTSYLDCPDCEGKRYNPATLEVQYNEKSIGDIMEMTLDEAGEFFKALQKIHRPLQLLCDTGLGYLALGQASPTLSGGEAQRLKLVSELTRGVSRSQSAKLRQQATKSMLYLLEEPTIGLHMADVQQLLKVLHRLVDDGHTVIIIEHHLSLAAEADYVIDIGPEAGPEGGEVVAAGTPEQVALSKRSQTAPFLREVLGMK